MSPDHSEKSCARPLAWEIKDINREFLHLLTHPEAASSSALLGLQGVALAGLRRLSPGQLDSLAAVPLLLTEFGAFPGQAEVRENPPLPADHIPTSVIWQAELSSFANRLMTCIWQTARHDPLLAALYMGISRRHCQEISQQSFSAVSRYGGHAAESLRVRLSTHPHFWCDLVRCMTTGNPDQQVAARLSLLQLSVPGVACGRATMPAYG